MKSCLLANITANFNYVYVCIHVHKDTTCECKGGHRGQNSMELRVALSCSIWVLGSELRSSAGAASTVLIVVLLRYKHFYIYIVKIINTVCFSVEVCQMGHDPQAENQM